MFRSALCALALCLACGTAGATTVSYDFRTGLTAPILGGVIVFDVDGIRLTMSTGLNPDITGKVNLGGDGIGFGTGTSAGGYGFGAGETMNLAFSFDGDPLAVTIDSLTFTSTVSGQDITLSPLSLAPLAFGIGPGVETVTAGSGAGGSGFQLTGSLGGPAGGAILSGLTATLGTSSAADAPLGVAPLPATLPLLLGGLLGFAVFAAPRRSGI